MSKYNIRNPRNRLRNMLVIMAGLFVLVLVASYAVWNNYTYNLKPVSSSAVQQIVTVTQGSTVREIAVLLKEKNLIRTVWAFEWYVNSNEARDQLKAGTYRIAPDQSVADIVQLLVDGKVATDLVTILPAQRLDQIRASLIGSGFAASDIERALDPRLYINHPALVDKPRGANLEGYLYPESFHKTAETKPEVIVEASLDEMHKNLTPDLRAAIVRQGLTVHQGVILASIVEQEVSSLEDRRTVAQVFLSRLRQEWALESDATADYGAVLAGQPPSPGYDSVYNTYNHKGLPPSPISNVSKSSLEAVANPSPTDFLYFVSGDPDEEGRSITHFSRTLEEHQALTAKYCKKQCAR